MAALTRYPSKSRRFPSTYPYRGHLRKWKTEWRLGWGVSGI